MLSKYSSDKPSSKPVSSNRFKCGILVQHYEGLAAEPCGIHSKVFGEGQGQMNQGQTWEMV